MEAKRQLFFLYSYLFQSLLSTLITIVHKATNEDNLQVAYNQISHNFQKES